MTNILDSLNPAQREAVEHLEGPLLIFAGAGSGKTRALTHRIAYLIREHGVHPRNILAVTFTNKAAREMKERIESLVGSQALSDMWVGTFHAMSARLLRISGEKIGIHRDFVIYDESDQSTVVRECLEELNIDEKMYPPKTILYKISHAKEQMVLPEDYASAFAHRFDPIVARVYPLYQEKLKANRALDFDDLIFHAVRLLDQCPDVRELYQTKFEHVLVDEYQDINQSQFELVRFLAGYYRNICVVGDDDQSIYSWRGADVELILSFQKHYKDAKVVKLEQNYRSSRNILDAAYHVISRNERRAEKQLWTDRDGGALLTRIEAVDEHDEAAKVVSQIRERVRSGECDYGDFVVLYRMNAQSRLFEEALMNYRVPYRIIGGVRFYERKEIKDLMAYLRLVYNPMDSVSLKRIINVPVRSIGPATLAKIESFAQDEGTTLVEALRRVEEIEIQPKPKRAIKELSALLDFLHEKREEYPVGKLLKEIVENTGFLTDLQKAGTREADSRVENVKELFSVVEEFENTSEDVTLRSFLEQVALVTDIDSLEEGQEAITLMTLHAAKGLEFPVVFMVGMEDGLFPHSRSIQDRDGLEEERRLCYVGMTRAEDELFLCHAYCRTMYGMRERSVPSRFLRDIPLELFGRKKIEQPSRPTAAVPGVTTGAAFRPKEAAPRPAAKCPFKAGDRVKHNVFGAGIVVGAQAAGTDYQVSVAFEDVGIKKLMLSFAPLEKVEL
ncbi:MAG: DNA helicase PcrA [Armatimonadetes bacterium]|nr:DNA helicase PcrA [Armatimonadota bacterium]